MDWYSFLGRPRLPDPPASSLQNLRGKSILITGAGGSIASALALRMAEHAPRLLTLLEASESHLFHLQQRWTNADVDRPTAFVLGSVADHALLEEIFAWHAPQIVIHAAAFKHVPLLEQQPLAAIANNIFGTQRVVDEATRAGARVVLLSTDKAVEPTSIMGATKRVAEQIVLAAGGVVLRLCNVLASRDSVAEIFADQIARGGPITITDPQAKRYFVTLDEAIDLLLHTAGDRRAPALLVPALDHPHCVADLAHFMEAQMRPQESVEIRYTGLRPGEKQSETLVAESECVLEAAKNGLCLLQPFSLQKEYRQILSELDAALSTRDAEACLSLLNRLVPDFCPSTSVRAAALTSLRVEQ